MRPCYFINEVTPSAGGSYKSVGLFQEALGGQIYSLSTNHETGRRCELGKIEYFNIPNDHLAGKAHVLELGKRVTNQFSLISCHKIFRAHNIYTRKVAKNSSIPYWVVPHGSMDPWVFTYGRLQKMLWLRLFGNRYFRDAAHIILATEREMLKMQERYCGSNMRVVHWPVEPLNTSQRTSARLALRARLDLPSDARILLHFGRYHTMKRPVETMRLFECANLSSRTHLVLAGYDDNLTRGDLVRSTGQHPRIHVLPPVRGEARDELLLGSDGYVSLSYRENFNHTAAEAMTAGQPLILSPGNDLQYSFPKGSNFGWMLETNSDANAIKAMQEFDQASTDRLSTMGLAAQHWALTNLSFESFQNSLEALLQEATGSV